MAFVLMGGGLYNDFPYRFPMETHTELDFVVTTEEKIREAYERITTNSGFKQTVGGFICFKAGYLAAQRETFEQAAKLVESPNTLVTKYSIASAIRQLIKE